jgi:hypothetical protein
MEVKKTLISIFYFEKYLEEIIMSYAEFIQNILDARGRFICDETYYERHHIIPKCLGGTDDDDNLIDLLAREHFVAHKLLAQENPENNKLTCAWWMMSHIGRVEITSEEYEEARIVFSNMQRELHIGTSISEEIRQKMRESHLGENNINYGKPRTEETRCKISESNKNYWTDENRRRHSELAAQYCTDVWRKNNGNAHKKRIAQYTKDNIFIREWDSVKSAGETLHINRSNISACLKNKHKTAGGFVWKYVSNN